MNLRKKILIYHSGAHEMRMENWWFYLRQQIYLQHSNLSKQNNYQKSKKKRAEKCLTVHREKFEISSEYQGKQAVNWIKETLLLSVKLAIRDLLASLEDAEYDAMNFIGHSRLDYDDSTYAIDDIKMLANHFSTTLIHADFKLDAAVFEFRQLKKLVKSCYQHFSHSTSLWKTIGSKHHDQYPHILLHSVIKGQSAPPP